MGADCLEPADYGYRADCEHDKLASKRRNGKGEEVKPHLIYRLQRLDLDRGAVIFPEPVLFWPAGKTYCLVLPGNGWPAKPVQLTSGSVKSISYSISATTEKVCVAENFVHAVVKGCVIASKSGSSTFIHGAPLFTAVDAAWLLKTPALKGLKAIQFVC